MGRGYMGFSAVCRWLCALLSGQFSLSQLQKTLSFTTPLTSVCPLALAQSTDNSLETAFCVSFWAPVEKGSALILSSFRITSPSLPSSKVLTESVSSHIPLWRKVPRQSTGIPKLPSVPLCSHSSSMADHSPPRTAMDSPLIHTFPTSQHTSWLFKSPDENKPTTTQLPRPSEISSVININNLSSVLLPWL